MKNGTGLKRQIVWLAPLLGLKSDALYERQRELVRMGMLEKQKPDSRGPHSGVPATVSTVSSLVAVCLSVDHICDMSGRGDIIAKVAREVEQGLHRCAAGEGSSVTTEERRGAMTIRRNLSPELMVQIFENLFPTNPPVRVARVDPFVPSLKTDPEEMTYEAAANSGENAA